MPFEQLINFCSYFLNFRLYLNFFTLSDKLKDIYPKSQNSISTNYILSSLFIENKYLYHSISISFNFIPQREPKKPKNWDYKYLFY